MKTRATYSPNEKMDVIISILSRKTSIQKASKEKGIAPTLISLWKKQAEDAILARFQPQPKGRKKATPEVVSPREIKNDARKAKIKAAHLEASLKDAKARISALESAISSLVTGMGYKLTKVRRTRRTKSAKA